MSKIVNKKVSRDTDCEFFPRKFFQPIYNKNEC